MQCVLGGVRVESLLIFPDTYSSPEEAFEEAKRALMMASEKLKTGEENLNEIKRFHHATVAVSGSK